MKIVLITQRVMKIDKINETRDCIDQRWIKFVKKLDLIPIFTQ